MTSKVDHTRQPHDDVQAHWHPVVGQVMGLHGLELRTLISSHGTLRLWLEDVPVPGPAADEVVVRVEAAPINPSDIGVLLGPADLATLKGAGTVDRPEVTATVPGNDGVSGRVDRALAAGNEGAGTIVVAGRDAQDLVGRVVAARSFGMYAQYRVVKLADCLVLPEGTAPPAGASAFINPLTALGMVETMRLEGHTAIVHTAAASNLGQMLTRLCVADGIPLVTVVRSQDQADVLGAIGARYVVDSTSRSFIADLDDAIAETGATLAFDAIGGGDMASTILASMERALLARTDRYSRYGSPIHKQVYLYGNFDPARTEIHRSFGMAWGISGWLMTWFMDQIGPEQAARLRARVAAELTTIFASHFTAELSLAGALSVDAIKSYTRRATGDKYLINPGLGLD
jgi:NADPH:quinone reductase-like Zn-dependent oxidoreductase